MSDRRGANPYEDLARRTTSSGPSRGLVIGIAAVFVVVVLGVVAIFLTGNDGAGGNIDAVQEQGPVEVSGEPLQPMPRVDGFVVPVELDPAVGSTPPTLEGQDFEQGEVSIDPAVQRVDRSKSRWRAATSTGARAVAAKYTPGMSKFCANRAASVEAGAPQRAGRRAEGPAARRAPPAPPAAGRAPVAPQQRLADLRDHHGPRRPVQVPLPLHPHQRRAALPTAGARRPSGGLPVRAWGVEARDAGGPRLMAVVTGRAPA